MGNFFNSCHELSVVAKKGRCDIAKPKQDEKEVKPQKSGSRRFSKESKETSPKPEKRKSLNKSESSFDEDKSQQAVRDRILS